MEFMPCPYFLMYDSEAMLPPLNENPTHDLTYLSRHTPRSIAIHDNCAKSLCI